MCRNVIAWSEQRTIFPHRQDGYSVITPQIRSGRSDERTQDPAFPAEALQLERCAKNLIITPVTTWQTTSVRLAHACYECVFVKTFTWIQQCGIQRGEMKVWSREKNKVRDRILPPWSGLWAWWRWGKTIWTTPPPSRHVAVFVTKLKHLANTNHNSQVTRFR